MEVCIHQPNYLPYLGFFHKIKNADVYVLLDVAQYVKNRFDNKNLIRTKKGSVYLTIPLLSKDCYLKRLYEVKLPAESRWKKKHWKSIEAHYAKADYFECYKDSLKRIYETNFTKLVDVNEAIIRFLIKEFELETTIIKSTDLNIDTNLKSTDLLINILTEVGATVYLSGPTGKKYIAEEKFKLVNIKLEYQNFVHPVYKQRFDGFVKNMAAIDLLFNAGEKSKELI